MNHDENGLTYRERGFLDTFFGFDTPYRDYYEAVIDDEPELIRGRLHGICTRYTEQENKQADIENHCTR